jgi:hypothetical protein
MPCKEMKKKELKKKEKYPHDVILGGARAPQDIKCVQNIGEIERREAHFLGGSRYFPCHQKHEIRSVKLVKKKKKKKK